MARQVLIREKVYDPILRILHAWNGLAILLLVISSLVAEWPSASRQRQPPSGVFTSGPATRCCSAWSGRMAWGVNGPGYARLSALWHWREWLAALRARQLLTEPAGFGHHPLASAAYLAFYLAVLAMAASGLALAAVDQGRGPLVIWLGHDVTLKHLFMNPTKSWRNSSGPTWSCISPR
jgi:Ni/Fe-hydrogenase 1 B-type cytochrome subunit